MSGRRRVLHLPRRRSERIKKGAHREGAFSNRCGLSAEERPLRTKISELPELLPELLPYLLPEQLHLPELRELLRLQELLLHPELLPELLPS